MSPHRRTAAIAGVLYLLTIVTSIPALALKEPLLKGTVSAGTLSGARLAMVLELVLAVACVGTAVVLHPVLRQFSEALSLGFVAARTVEAATIVVGVLAVLGLVTRASVTGRVTGTAEPMLVALHDWAFLVGPGLVPAVNALCLGTVLLRARLVPRIIPAVGLVGAPLLIASALATVAGRLDQVSAVAGVLALPIAAWEVTLGLWLTVKGFRREAFDRAVDVAPGAPGPARPLSRA